ncbi:hypothetical protein ZWY2020_014429 [Hordeum vulgare]|nr:hypothetical protein ZWY2020_014429 [Hordeum vulgare]
MALKDAALREKEGALVQMQSQLAKALESAATLREEVARLTHASKVRELEVLESAHETDGAFHRLFPATQVAADTAIEVSHEERRAAGQEVDTTSGWSVEEIGVGIRARLHALGESVAQLQPSSVSTGQQARQRDGSEVELQGGEEALRVRASGIADYAAWYDFVLERGEDGGVIPEDLHGLQPYDPDGSSGEAARAADSAAASSGAAYADSGEDASGSPREGDGATASGAAGDGEATTSGAAAGATDEAAAP